MILVSEEFLNIEGFTGSFGWVGLVGLSACFVVAEVDCVSRVGFRSGVVVG